MDCKVTCFQRVMHLVKPLPKEKYEEAVEIIREDSFVDFLEFCIENDCFTKEQATTLYEGIIMWEDLESNYHEEDSEKLLELYDKLGITEEVFSEYPEEE